MSNGKKTPGAMIKYGFPDAQWIEGWDLHSLTFQLNVSALSGIGGAFRGCLWGVQGGVWG
jgi:hypothetical protein